MPREVFVHPAALCESDQVGAGTKIWAFAHVMRGAVIGESCKISDHAFVESGAIVGNRVTIKNNVLIWDGVQIADDVFLGPNAVFTNVDRPRAEFKTSPENFGKTAVGRGATIGANSTIVCGNNLGKYSFVGAGTVVISDIADHALVVGNPSRQIGWVCECGKRLPQDLSCDCGRKYNTTSAGLEKVG